MTDYPVSLVDSGILVAYYRHQLIKISLSLQIVIISVILTNWQELMNLIKNSNRTDDLNSKALINTLVSMTNPRVIVIV